MTTTTLGPSVAGVGVPASQGAGVGASAGSGTQGVEPNGGFLAVMLSSDQPPPDPIAAQNALAAAGPGTGELLQAPVADVDGRTITALIGLPMADGSMTRMPGADPTAGGPASVASAPVLPDGAPSGQPSQSMVIAELVAASAAPGTVAKVAATTAAAAGLITPSGQPAAPGAPNGTPVPAAQGAGDSARSAGAVSAATTPPGMADPAAEVRIALSRVDESQAGRPAQAGAERASAQAATLAQGAQGPAQAPTTGAPAGQAVVEGLRPEGAPRADAGPPPTPVAGGATSAPVAGESAVRTAAQAAPLTSPFELAQELGTKLKVAVREGGRELTVSLRPPELGQLVVRVTVHEGSVQAQILADRPEAARLLSQALPHLGAALADMGYSVDDMDISYRDERDGAESGGDARAESERAAAGGADGLDGDSADGLTSSGAGASAAGATSELNLLV